MRGLPDSIDLIYPRNPREAVSVFSRNPKAVPLAGGTDFMVAWNSGHLNGRSVIDLSGLNDWRRIVRFDGGLRIGALATHAQLQEHPIVVKEFPLLVEACATVGAAQIQNRGTLGGNIANASPAGDSFPALAVYEAVVRVVGPERKRAVPFSGIFTGVKKTSLGASELISAVEIAFLSKRPTRSLFRKVGTRLAQAISKTVAAGLLWLGKDGKVHELRFALGSMAPTVRRLKTVEAFLTGKKITGKVVDEACRLVREDVSPIDDIRSTASYRLFISQNLLRQFLHD